MNNTHNSITNIKYNILKKKTHKTRSRNLIGLEFSDSTTVGSKMHSIRPSLSKILLHPTVHTGGSVQNGINKLKININNVALQNDKDSDLLIHNIKQKKYKDSTKVYKCYVASEFLHPNFINELFTKRGNWNLIPRNKLSLSSDIDYMYLDGIFLLDKMHYNINAKLKNTITDTNLIRKDNLIINLKKSEIGKKYILATENIDLYQISKNMMLLKNYKSFFYNKIIIFKPISGFAGAGIKCFNNYNDFQKYVKYIIIKWGHLWTNMKENEYYKLWVLQEYLTQPLLFKTNTSEKKYKFHIRHYFVFRPGDKKSFYLKRGLIIKAALPYINTNWANKLIHDTHLPNDKDAFKFPEDLKLNQEQINNLYSQLTELYSEINKILKANCKCFSDANNCYKLFGADLMLTNNYNFKILELNSSPGLGYSDTTELLSEKVSILENIMSQVVDDYFPPKNNVINPYADDVIFIE